LEEIKNAHPNGKNGDLPASSRKQSPTKQKQDDWTFQKRGVNGIIISGSLYFRKKKSPIYGKYLPTFTFTLKSTIHVCFLQGCVWVLKIAEVRGRIFREVFV